MYKIIPVAGPSISDKEIAYVLDAVTNGWYENADFYIKNFENAFKTYIGRQYAISLPSCTSALHLSLLALGIGPGDEVILPDATWIASAAPISYVGAKPIFADIDSNTWCISKKTVEPLISKNTKAIISVNLYGHMPDYDELFELGIPIIEDAAESIGSKYKNKLSGNFGVTSCFSFHGSKTLTTGEGGMLVTDDKSIYERCMIMRDHGRYPGDTLFQNVEVGYKYKMSNLQAALGLAQIERIDELVERKRSIYSFYSEIFQNCEWMTLNPIQSDVFNSFWMTTGHFNQNIKYSKFEIIEKLKEFNISTRPFFDPLSSLKAYSSFKDTLRAQNQNLKAYEISKNSINLPSSMNLTYEDIIKVKMALEQIILN